MLVSGSIAEPYVVPAGYSGRITRMYFYDTDEFTVFRSGFVVAVFIMRSHLQSKLVSLESEVDIELCSGCSVYVGSLYSGSVSKFNVELEEVADAN